VRALLPNVIPVIIYQMALVCRSSVLPANSTLAILQMAQALEHVTLMAILILVASFPVAIKVTTSLTSHVWPKSVRRTLKHHALSQTEPAPKLVILKDHN
jgi:hypothetical protein